MFSPVDWIGCTSCFRFSLLNMLFIPIKLNETEKELSGGNINYKQKYMKYKQKYMKLKKSLNK